MLQVKTERVAYVGRVSPVDVGVQQHRGVLRKLGEVDHFGLQLGAVALADPSVWKSVHIRK